MDLSDFINGFASQLDDIEASEITASTKFRELEEWSSLTALVIIAFVKTKYDKNITGLEIRSCGTIFDLFNLIETK